MHLDFASAGQKLQFNSDIELEDSKTVIDVHFTQKSGGDIIFESQYEKEVLPQINGKLQIRNLLLKSGSISSKLNLSGILSGAINNPRFEAQMYSKAFRFGDISNVPFQAHILFVDNYLTLKDISLNNQYFFEGEIDFAHKQFAGLNFKAVNGDVRLFYPIFGIDENKKFGGVINANLKGQGGFDNPNGYCNFTIDKFNYEGIAITKIESALTCANGTLNLNKFLAIGSKSEN